MIAKHKIFPDKSLKALLGVKSSKETLNKVSVKSLSEADLQNRNISLNVVAKMRKNGYSLEEAIKKHNDFSPFKVTEKTVKKHLGNTLYKEKGRWKVRKTDQIETRIQIYSKGEDTTIKIKESKDRIKISQYFNDVHKMLKGQISEKYFKKKWEGRYVRDTKGNKVAFETRREVIEELRGARSGDQFRSIYDTKTTV